MSGGAYEYQQFAIEHIAEEIEQRLLNAGRPIPRDYYDHWPEINREKRFLDETYPDYSQETIAIMKRTIYVLRMAYIYAQRVDWMLSGDDGEETLAIRLKEELDELNAKYPNGEFTFDTDKVIFDEELKHYIIQIEQRNEDTIYERFAP